jgi:hypothetical protein
MGTSQKHVPFLFDQTSMGAVVYRKGEFKGTMDREGPHQVAVHPEGHRRAIEGPQRILARKPEDFYSASARRRLPEVQRKAREALDEYMGKK